MATGSHWLQISLTIRSRECTVEFPCSIVHKFHLSFWKDETPQLENTFIVVFIQGLYSVIWRNCELNNFLDEAIISLHPLYLKVKDKPAPSSDLCSICGSFNGGTVNGILNLNEMTVIFGSKGPMEHIFIASYIFEPNLCLCTASICSWPCLLPLDFIEDTTTEI